MNNMKISRIKTQYDYCCICKRKFPLKSLLNDVRGKICVDCVVKVEMDTLRAEIENSKVLDD